MIGRDRSMLVDEPISQGVASLGPVDPDLVIGVGPHPRPWPDDPRFDPDLLEHGDRRNVADRYRYWTLEAIVDDLDACRHPFHVAIENWSSDMNIGTVVRNANAFNAAGVHIVGNRRWNRRGAMVTDRYVHVHHHPDIASLVQWSSDRSLPLIGIDNVEGSVLLESFEVPEACMMLFGQEGPGLSQSAREAVAAVCAIPMFGSTRSINAGVASGIAMHVWIQHHVLAGEVPKGGYVPRRAPDGGEQW